MKLVFGRGNKRRVVELPHGSEFARAARSNDPAEQATYKQAMHNLCHLLGIPGF